MKKYLEPPANWQDFEDICYLLWKFIWQDRHAQKNGRLGQPQHGVDVYGIPQGEKKYEGVQCKGKNAALGGKLSISEIKKELVKAKKFSPQIHHLVFATTSLSDSTLLEKVRALKSSDYRNIKISIKSWDEIDSDLRLYPEVMRAFYTDSDFRVEWRRDLVDFSSFVANATTEHIDQKIFDLMKADMAKMHISDPLRDELKNVASEIAFNAAIHSGAKSCQFRMLKNEFQIICDGTFFDIKKYLDNPKAIRRGGMTEIEVILKKYGADIELKSEIIKTGSIHKFTFTNELCKIISYGHTYEIQMEGLFFRSRVESSLKIPDGVNNLLLNLDKNSLPFSNFLMIINSIIKQMNASMVLTIKIHRGDSFISFIEENYYDYIRTGRLKIVN